jgi:5'-nucleotidase
LPTQTLLNVNVPSLGELARSSLRGYRWTKLGKRIYRDQVDERADLRGRRYYWIGGPAQGYGDVPGSDCHAVRDGIVSVTPLDLDLTHAGLLDRLPDWSLQGFDRVLEDTWLAGESVEKKSMP